MNVIRKTRPTRFSAVSGSSHFGIVSAASISKNSPSLSVTLKFNRNIHVHDFSSCLFNLTFFFTLTRQEKNKFAKSFKCDYTNQIHSWTQNFFSELKFNGTRFQGSQDSEFMINPTTNLIHTMFNVTIYTNCSISLACYTRFSI